MSKRYCIRIQLDNGFGYLIHRDRSSWTRRTALKHLRDWQANFPGRPATIEEE